MPLPSAVSLLMARNGSSNHLRATSAYTPATDILDKAGNVGVGVSVLVLVFGGAGWIPEDGAAVLASQE